MELPEFPFERTFEPETPAYLEFMDNTWEATPFEEPVELTGEDIANDLPHDKADLPIYERGDHEELDREASTGQVSTATRMDTDIVAMPKRSRRDRKPRLVAQNPYGRAGCRRCRNCRKWRQRCIFDSLERACKLCEKRGLACALDQKVFGPKTQPKSESPLWIDKHRGQDVLSFNQPRNLVSSSELESLAQILSSDGPSSDHVLLHFNSSSTETQMASPQRQTRQLPEAPPFALSFNSARQVSNSILRFSSLLPGKTAGRDTFLPVVVAQAFEPKDLTSSSMSMVPEILSRTLSPHCPDWEVNTAAAGIAAHHTPDENIHLRAFMRRNFFETLPIHGHDVSSIEKDDALSLVASFIFGPSHSKIVSYGALAYEFLVGDNDRHVSEYYLERCLESLPLSSSDTIEELAYARAVALKVSFELVLPVSHCRRQLLHFSETVEQLRSAQPTVTHWRLLWMDTAEIYFSRRLWDSHASSFCLSPFAMTDIENIELLRQLDRSLASLPAHHFRYRFSSNTWLQSRRFQTSLHYHLAWFILQTNAVAEGSDPQVREEMIESTLQRLFNLTVMPTPLSEILMPLPISDLQFVDGPVANILDVRFLGWSPAYTKERLYVLSNSCTAYLFFQAFLSPSGQIGCDPLAGALCTVVCTRNSDTFCQDDIKDLFLAGLFSPKRAFPRRILSCVPFLCV